MSDSFLTHLRDLYNRREREMVTLSVRVSPEENAAIQDLADTAGITRQDVLYELVKKYALPAFQAQQSEFNAAEDLKEIPASEATSQNYYLVNTNKAHDIDDHNFMINNGRVAAFEDGYTQKITKIKKGDVVFLYESGVGIKAFGYASGVVQKTDHYNIPEKTFYQELNDFKILDKPMPAKRICAILERRVPFIQTMTRLKNGEIILSELSQV